ncbi:SPOSA6832_04138, partial [Sporobolomyces salmonicolor]
MAHHGLADQPFTRSRTNLFLSYRDSAVRPTSSAYSRYTPYAEDDDQAESAGLMVGQDDSGDGFLSRRGSAMSTSAAAAGRRRRGGRGKLPPKWVDLQEKVDEIVERLRPKIAQLDKLHSKHLLPGFKDRTAEEREIEALATSITSVRSSSLLRLRHPLCKLTTLPPSQDFRTCQAHIRKIAEQSKSLLAQRPTDPVDAESKRLELIMAANVQTALATKVQELSTTFRKKQSEYLRHLADLFKDLSSLVIDQGTLLDRIDYNVEQMSTEVPTALGQMPAHLPPHPPHLRLPHHYCLQAAPVGSSSSRCC